MSSGLFYHNSLHMSISNSRVGVWLVFITTCTYFIDIPVFNADSVDPDQVPNLGLHCLPIIPLGVSQRKWVKIFCCHFFKDDNFFRQEFRY